MIRHLGWLALVTMFLSAELAFPGGKDHEQKGEAPLVRPPGAPDPDAKGKVEIEHHADGTAEAFEIEAENLDPTGTYEVFLEDGPGSGTLASIGFLSGPGGSSDPSSDDGDDGDDGDDDDDGDDEDEEEFELEFDTEDGDSLPFGVPLAADLTGRAVEIRSGGVPLLAGVVPALGDGSDGAKSKVQSSLMRPEPAPDADAKGKVELSAHGAELEFEVEAEHVDATTIVYSVWVEEPLGSGVLQSVGTMSGESSSDSDEVKLELDTDDGESLPLGASSLDALAGRRIEVRGDDAQTYLVGTIPAFGGATVKATTTLHGKGNGAVKVRRAGKSGAQEFQVALKKQGKKAKLEVWIENPESGLLEWAADVAATSAGRANWRLRTKKGHPLPFGVLQVDALSGRPVEIRESGTGTLRLSGAVPVVP